MKAAYVNFSLVICLLTTLLICQPAMASETEVGKITRVKASVTVNGKRVKEGDLVFAKSTVVTDETGRVEITFKDSTVLTLGGETEFLIDKYSYDTDTAAPKALFKLTRGAFRTVTSTLVDANPDNFAVITPLVTIGIRGTDFWGGYLSPIEFDVVMLQGKGVIVTSMGGTVVLDEAGLGVTVPDPTKHPGGYAKALTLPEKTKWGSQKLSKVTATVAFD